MSANDKDNPLEPFKRATIATMRALAENDELDVTFGHGTPAASGNRMRVPLPSVGSTDAQINVVRGVGDEFALRLRYHDAAIYKRRSPREGPARRDVPVGRRRADRVDRFAADARGCAEPRRVARVAVPGSGVRHDHHRNRSAP